MHSCCSHQPAKYFIVGRRQEGGHCRSPGLGDIDLKDPRNVFPTPLKPRPFLRLENSPPALPVGRTKAALVPPALRRGAKGWLLALVQLAGSLAVCVFTAGRWCALGQFSPELW